MKRFIFVLLVFVSLAFSFSSCGEKKSSSEMKDAGEKAELPLAQDLVQVQDTSDEEQSALGQEAIEENSIFNQEKFYGTYMPTAYLNSLEKTKSHLKASAQFMEEYEDSPVVLYLGKDGMDLVWAFHEGSSEDLLEFTEEYVATSAFEEVYKYVLADGSVPMLTRGQTEYKQIAHTGKEEFSSVEKYIAKVLFGNASFSNQNATLSFSEGNIRYLEKVFLYGTDIFFSSKTYDTLSMQEKPYESRYIEILQDRINIYNAVIPKEYKDDLMCLDYATYELENSFEF